MFELGRSLLLLTALENRLRHRGPRWIRLLVSRLFGEGVDGFKNFNDSWSRSNFKANIDIVHVRKED